MWYRLRGFLFSCGAIVAVWHCFAVGGTQFLMVGVFWGFGIAVGLRSGVERAPTEAWKRQRSRTRRRFEFATLLAIIWAPAAVSLLWVDPVTRLALALLITFSAGVASLLLTRCFGENGTVKNRAG